MLSQRDNRISRQMNQVNMRLTEASVSIAKTAKADSSAMKAIAVVSTIFLPGTFVSVSQILSCLECPISDIKYSF